MATPILMPKQGNSVESCIIVQWLKNVGETVAAGDPVCEIETDKSTFEVTAPVAGTLLAQFFAADDDVPVMINIAAIGDAGEDVQSLRPGEAADDVPAAEPVVSPVVESVPVPVVQSAATPATSQPTHTSTTTSSGISPRARHLAQNHALDTALITGTGPAGRIIERDIQQQLAQAPRLSALAKQDVLNGQAQAPTQGTGVGGMVVQSDLRADLRAGVASAASNIAAYQDIPVKGIRKVIAERMLSSLNKSAQLTMTMSFCADSLQQYRQSIKEQGEKIGLPNITINDMIIYAVSRVLKRHPTLNAQFLGNMIRQFNDVHIGVAVDTDRGLLVPVLRNADKRSLANLSANFKPLAQACQAGKASPDDLQGGTFTVTNLGALGVETFTPVLNVPEVAILGVGGLQLKPYQTANGEVVFKQAICLSLTIDHQAVDGAPGARFLQDLVNTLEHFELSLAE